MTKGDTKEIRESFVKLLSEDVIDAFDRRDLLDTQTNRRNLMRTMFAAIEGLVWVYQQHVRSVAEAMDIDAGGLDSSNAMYMPFKDTIKSSTKLAKIICPELKADFSGSGWQDLQIATDIRNRITHPKTSAHLKIAEADLAISQSAFFWLLGFVDDVMGRATSASAAYLLEMRSMLEKLKSGDEATLAAYRKVQAERD